MRKTQFALAAVALIASTAALADGITIYGNLDYGIQSSKVANTDGDKVRTTSMETGLVSPNFLGFKGSEDLDGGMKADFHLQATTNMDAATQFGFTQSDIGISGTFGQVRIGKTVDPMWANGIAAFDAAGGSNMGSAVTPAIYTGMTSVFPNNTVTYHSPDIGGLSFHGQMRQEGSPGNNQKTGDGYSITGLYAAGPISAGAGYTHTKIDIAADATTFGVTLGAGDTAKGNMKGYFVGAGYDMNVAKINALYMSNKLSAEFDIADLGSGNGSLTADTWGLNGSIPMGATRFIAGYYQTTYKSTELGLSNKSKMYHLTAFYDLSKRTSLFANYQSVSADNNASLALPINGGGTSPVASQGTANALTVGVRHSF